MDTDTPDSAEPRTEPQPEPQPEPDEITIIASRLDTLEITLTAILEQNARIESMLNDRSNSEPTGNTEPGNIEPTNDGTAPNSTETRASTEEPRIKPNRTHPYFRKIW